MTLAALLLSLADKNTYYYTSAGLVLRTKAASRVLPMLCARGDFFAHDESQRHGPLRWDGDEPWRFELAMEGDDESADFLVRGWYCRGDMRRPLDEAVRLLRDGWVVWPDAIGRLESTTGFEWIALLRQKKHLKVKADEAEDFVTEAMKRLNLPYLKLPPSLHIEEVRLPPAPRLNIHQSAARPGRLVPLTVAFAYEDVVVRAQPERPRLDASGQRRIVYRDLAAERAHVERAALLGVRRQHSYVEEDPQYAVDPARLPDLVRTLLAEQWSVAAENRPVRTSSAFSVSVASGIDWFDVTVQCDFGGVQANLPALLAAARDRREWIELSDGTWGMVPEQWLKQYAGIASLGQAEATTIRFRNNQAALLDAWLAGQPDVSIDDLFHRTRERLAAAGKAEPAEAPEGFRGTLRPYQQEGLGWLRYLQQMGFGGCLADDMGLGKTVQVLALLEERRMRRAKEKLPPSLIIVPRSLLFNWMQEAAKFAPELRLLDFTGGGRAVDAAAWKGIDVILTTYGTLRRDIEQLKELEFDYVILDEAQAVKNAAALTAKSVRLLRARHRLAMSGTPVENHLGEVWSLFEFLNPGLLGAASAFSQSIARDAAPEQRALLGRALRPFMLRRTKGQVAKDLPDRQEDTVYCEMETAQRKHYDELRDYYRKALLEKVATDGINKSKIVVLEALLRLRQAACHPALIDKARAAESCAKFDALLPQLAEVIEEGHKALVFSQFTGFLALLRKELDERGIVYEYLDGKTRDRQARVERFQTDSACPLFLISLKAGGVGLNLTAAEYVFLLDPWWNPAVEAQAIDRAHRIGQTRKVMAYRLIARDTVEEKVLALQEGKRELATAILSEDNAVLRNLTIEDLTFLLG
jgi:superfamily II DNA or RNA helicase